MNADPFFLNQTLCDISITIRFIQFYRCVAKDKCDSSAILIRRRQPDLTGVALAEDASCINSAESEVFGSENSLSQTCCNEKDIKDKEVTIGKTDF